MGWSQPRFRSTQGESGARLGSQQGVRAGPGKHEASTHDKASVCGRGDAEREQEVPTSTPSQSHAGALEVMV